MLNLPSFRQSLFVFVCPEVLRAMGLSTVRDFVAKLSLATRCWCAWPLHGARCCRKQPRIPSRQGESLWPSYVLRIARSSWRDEVHATSTNNELNDGAPRVCASKRRCLLLRAWAIEWRARIVAISKLVTESLDGQWQPGHKCLCAHSLHGFVLVVWSSHLVHTTQRTCGVSSAHKTVSSHVHHLHGSGAPAMNDRWGGSSSTQQQHNAPGPAT